MKILSASAAVFIFGITAFSPPSVDQKVQEPQPVTATVARDPKIQAAILLDVSNSMDGLIEQAKVQLWNMVSVMGKVKCENGIPKIEIALYEYGKDSNDPKAGYIRQISAFSSDLDNLSQQLFNLNTLGGSEYCGQVIHTSLNELRWDSTATNYKVIFIAGNEDFLQGNITYTQACTEAKRKGVIVNTIYCGDKAQGIKEHWNLGSECGNGSFTNIDQNVKIEEISTPYDSTLFSLNSKINGTYLAFGQSGESSYKLQADMDVATFRGNKYAAANRVVVKGYASAYNNAGWDMVDAYVADSVSFFRKLDTKTLPDSLKTKKVAELEHLVKQKKAERAAIQQQILELNTQREKYIAAERSKQANNNVATLESAVEKIIREQVKRFNMYVE